MYACCSGDVAGVVDQLVLRAAAPRARAVHRRFPLPLRARAYSKITKLF